MPTPFTTSSLPDLTWLPQTFASLGLTPDAIAALAPALEPGKLQQHVRGIETGLIPGFNPKSAALARLFVLGVPTPREAVVAALGQSRTDQLLQANILTESSPDSLAATISLSPAGGLVVAADHYLSDQHPKAAPDFVLPVGNATTLTANLTVREPIDRALDIGVGQGFQSALAAAHAKRVIATDINPRALDFTRLTAAINNRTTIDLRLGSFLDPITDADAPFGLIVSNPPFIINVKQANAGITSSIAADGAVELLARRAPALLADGGWMTMLISWLYTQPAHADRSADWAARPRSWLANSRCDAWILRFTAVDASTYGQQLSQGDRTGETTDLAEWQRFCQERNATHVAFGAIILKKRLSAAASNWVRIDDVPIPSIRGQSSDRIRDLFRCTTLLASSPGQALLDARLRAAPDARSFPPPQWANLPEGVTQLQHTAAIALPINLGQDVADHLHRFTGERPARDVIAQILPPGTPPAEIEKRGLPILRALLQRAYLIPVA